MSTLLQEVRFALRSMLREKAFTAVVVATLALSVGATTAVFSVAYQVLWRPLPYPEASQLFRLFQTTTPGAGAGPQRDRTRITLPVWTAWREGARSFAQLEGIQGQKVTLRGAQSDERLRVARASAGLLPMLGVKPVLGRLWGTELEVPGRDREAVLSHALWQRLYGGDPSVLGRSLLLDDESHTIVGVLPAGFQFEPEMEVWKPLVLDPRTEQNSALRVVGRLRPHVTPEQAKAELVQLALNTDRVSNEPLVGASLEPLHAFWVEQSHTQLEIVTAVAALLLLLGCANLANLLLARGSLRMREMSVRMALGARRAQLIRLLLIESLVRALAGGGVGVLVALWGRELMSTLIPPQLASGPGIEPFVLVIACVLSVVTAVLVGLLPALYATRGDGQAVLAPVARGLRGASMGMARTVLVVVQLSLALVPLVGTGLMLRTVWELQHVPLGFEPQGVTVGELFVPLDPYASQGAAAAVAQDLVSRVEALPGVTGVGLTGALPFSGEVFRQTVGFELVGGHASPETKNRAGYVSASEGYFRTLGVPLKEGRYPNAQDTEHSPLVVAVTEAFARRHFPGQSAVGKRIALEMSWGSREPREIVGVVGDVPMERLTAAPSGDIYVPLGQDMPESMSLAVKSHLPAGQLMPLLRETLRSTDSRLRLGRVRPLDELVKASYARMRTVGGLLSALALLAVVLAAVGLYGILSFWVAQQTRELGIRLALGATPSALLRRVVGQGLRLTGVGLVAGLVGATLLARALSSLLYGVSAYDPLIFVGAPGVLLITALAASWLPASAAMRVPPNEALKRES